MNNTAKALIDFLCKSYILEITKIANNHVYCQNEQQNKERSKCLCELFIETRALNKQINPSKQIRGF